MDESKVILLSNPIATAGCNQIPHYAPIIIQCINAVVEKGKYSEFSIIHNKVSMLYFFNKSCPFFLVYFPIIIIVQNV